MKNWFLSLHGAIALSVTALLTFLGRLFLDWRYESRLLGPAGSFEEAVNVLLFLAFAGGWIWAMLVAGLLSLQAGYAETVGRSGRNILRMGAVGAVLCDMVILSLIVMASSGILHATHAQGQRFWIVGFGAPAVPLLALPLFGLNALRSNPMSRLNWLSILAGIWYWAVYFFLFGYLISHNGVLPDQYWPVVKFTFAIQFFALFVLGVVLVNDAPQEMATA